MIPTMRASVMIRVLVLVVGLVPSLAACSSSGKDAKSPAITVFAAASLKSAFEEIAKDHDGTVTFNFDGSQNLVSGLENGARADVLATADQITMKKAAEKQLVAPPNVFATNTLVLVTPRGNPGKVTGLDSSLDGKKLVICAEGVPCGNGTARLAQNLGVTLKPVSEEQKVTDVLGKVTSGEADAGIVYATDAKSAGDKVDVVKISGADKVVNWYPIAPTASAKDRQAAEKFVVLVLSDKGRQVLEKYGFETP